MVLFSACRRAVPPFIRLTADFVFNGRLLRFLLGTPFFCSLPEPERMTNEFRYGSKLAQCFRETMESV